MQYKTVLLGDSGIGKTSICRRQINKIYSKNQETTIGAMLFTTKIDFLDNDINRTVKLEVWDTAGQEKYRSIAPIYYKSSKCVILCFDITDPRSFNSIKNYWMTIFTKNNNNQYFIKKYYTDDPIYLVLVGTKKDMAENRKVQLEDINNFCNYHSIEYFETSAMNNENINELFLDIAKKTYLINNTKITPINNTKITPINNTIDINNNPLPKTNYCCYFY